jgi:UDP-N-acetylmuramate dehydrogenase
MKQYRNASLAKHHTFHTNESAQLITELETAEEAVKYLKEPSTKRRFVLGQGSNVLFVRSFDGELIKICNSGVELIKENTNWVWIKAAAGMDWDAFVDSTIGKGYGGIENLSYIPGTVGAAPIQNIGAYGVELSDIFDHLEAVNLKNGMVQKFYLNDMCFDYRNSIFKGIYKNKFLVLNVVLRLSKNPSLKLEYGNLKETVLETISRSKPTIKDVRNAVIKIRKSKLPDPSVVGNAGSFFKNPIIDINHLESLKKKFPAIVYFKQSESSVKLAAAWMIDQCGLKGEIHGNTGTHSKHALIIINNGKATGEEIKNFSEFVQLKVKTKFGIQLEPEVQII